MVTTDFRIRCGTIWGGIESVNLDVATSGISASVFSQASDGSAGGDVYYFSVCSKDLLTRVAIADLQGHGGQASSLGSWFYESLESHMNDLAGNCVLESVNNLVVQKGFRAITTAIVATYDLEDSTLYFSNAGHGPLLLQRAHESRWSPLESPHSQQRRNLPLGVFADMAFDQACVPMTKGDRLLLYTDGIIECEDRLEEPFGMERLIETLDDTNSLHVREIKERVLAAASLHASSGIREDDVTLVFLEV